VQSVHFSLRGKKFPNPKLQGLPARQKKFVAKGGAAQISATSEVSSSQNQAPLGLAACQKVR